MKLPGAETSEIVVQDLGQELLVYDLKSHKAYTLNETSKIVFESCDGNTSFDELKRRHKFTDDLIRFALDELKAHDLLKDYRSDHFAGMSRREIIKKVGLVSVAALPVIAGMTAPQAAAASSANCQGQSCTFSNYTQSNCCNASFRCSDAFGGGGQCVACYTGTYAFPANTVANCNSYASKNLCCNTTGTPTINASNFCVCPS